MSVDNVKLGKVEVDIETQHRQNIPNIPIEIYQYTKAESRHQNAAPTKYTKYVYQLKYTNIPKLKVDIET
jgi:hypothetical protein